MERDLIAMLPRLRRYARVLTGTLQHADNLVLDTLACARRKQDPRQRRTNLRTWLFTIMHELHADASSHLRQNLARTPRNGDDDSGDLWKIPAEGIQSSRTELGEMLGHFSLLPVEQREILVLVAVERLPYADIATLLGVPIATVMARLNRARESMHTMTN